MKWNESKIKRARERENEWEKIVCEYNMCRLDSIGMNSRHKSHLLVFVWALHMLWLRFCVCAFSVSLLPTTKLTKRLSVHSYSPSWFYTHTHLEDRPNKETSSKYSQTHTGTGHTQKEGKRDARVHTSTQHTHAHTNFLSQFSYSFALLLFYDRRV